MKIRSHVNMLRYLERRAPQRLEALREADPDNYVMLHPKVLFSADRSRAASTPSSRSSGEQAVLPAATVVLDPKQRDTALELARTYAEQVSFDLTELLGQLDARLRGLQWAKMAGGALALIGGATLAAMPHLGVDEPVLAVGTAVLSCAGGLLTLVAGAYERNGHGLRSTAADYRELLDKRAELNAIRRQLDGANVFGMNDAEVVRLYNRCGEIADEIVVMKVFK